jgi:hypothetical protein
MISEQAILLKIMEFRPQHGAWRRHYLQQHYHPDMRADTILLGKAITFPNRHLVQLLLQKF